MLSSKYICFNNYYEIESKYENSKNKYINQICNKVDMYKKGDDFDVINYVLNNTIIDCSEFQR